MKRQRVPGLVALAFLLCVGAVAGHAQDVSSASNNLALAPPGTAGEAARPTAALPQQSQGTTPYDQSSVVESKVDIFLGYSYVNTLFDVSFNSSAFEIIDPVPSINSGLTGNHGWNIAVMYNLSHNVALTANFRGNYASQDITFESFTCPPPTFICSDVTVTARVAQDMHFFLFGPKFTHHDGKLQMYAHTLVGVARGGSLFRPDVDVTGGCCFTAASTWGTGFGLASGGGVDWMFNDRWGWRILEVDFLYANLENGKIGNGTTGIVASPSLSTGLIFRFGRR